MRRYAGDSRWFQARDMDPLAARPAWISCPVVNSCASTSSAARIGRRAGATEPLVVSPHVVAEQDCLVASRLGVAAELAVLTRPINNR